MKELLEIGSERGLTNGWEKRLEEGDKGLAFIEKEAQVTFCLSVRKQCK